jgi:hypothetical protein
VHNGEVVKRVTHVHGPVMCERTCPALRRLWVEVITVWVVALVVAMVMLCSVLGLG